MRILAILLAALVTLSSLTACRETDSADLAFEGLDVLRLERTLTIGSLDADSIEAFTWFRDLAVGEDGRIYTVHPQERRLRVWSASGGLLGTIEPGDGPGELGNPHELGIRGDTLWIMDGDGFVLQKYDLDGSFLVGERLGMGRAREGERYIMPRGLLVDGGLYGSRPAWSAMIASGEISADTLFRLDRDLTILDTLLVRPQEVWAIRNPDANEPSFASYAEQPFGDADIVALDPSSPAVYRIERHAAAEAAIDSFRVTRRTFAGDTLYSRVYRYVPEPLDPSSVENVIRERAARYEDPPFPTAPTVAQAAEWARATLVVPEFLPPVSEAVAGNDGTLWIARERADSATRWIVLSTTGQPLGSVDVPERVRVIHATRHSICGSFTDELEVPYVVCYRVAPDAANG
ncbi:MAG: hypothetical protein ACRELV_17075 [Longimicrobiales bacterium]